MLVCVVPSEPFPPTCAYQGWLSAVANVGGSRSRIVGLILFTTRSTILGGPNILEFVRNALCSKKKRSYSDLFFTFFPSEAPTATAACDERGMCVSVL